MDDSDIVDAISEQFIKTLLQQEYSYREIYLVNERFGEMLRDPDCMAYYKAMYHQRRQQKIKLLD